jgi:hypothetical protein
MMRMENITVIIICAIIKENMVEGQTMAKLAADARHPYLVMLAARLPANLDRCLALRFLREHYWYALSMGG